MRNRSSVLCHALTFALALFLSTAAGVAAKKASTRAAKKASSAAAKEASNAANLEKGLCAAASRHTGRPYVWGAVGLKSFDCSGYLWRTFLENGVMMKRTTARKFYMCLAAVPESLRYATDTIVFFDNLKHVGIVNDDSTFYHAQSSKGTNLSHFDPYWRRKVFGFRRLKG